MVVQTVLGEVSESALGRTLTHEHFALDFSHFYRAPPPHLADRLAGGITLQNVGLHRQYPYSSRYNLRFDDADARAAVINDVIAYKASGGGTIVENTTSGLGRDLALMKRVAAEAGVHVVAGTGHYIADLQPASTLGLSAERLYEHMLHELTVGCHDDPSVKAGFMGEIASVWPLKEFELRAVAAAGEVQAQLGCGVSFHPHRDPAAPAHIVRRYLEAGGRADKAVMSHLDRTFPSEEQLLEFAELGTYCQFDLFGVECSHYQLHPPTDMPSDAQRLQRVAALVRAGRAHRVLLSHDIHTKHRLSDFGGHGFSHIIDNIVPRMLERGLSQETVDLITVANPACWLGFAPAQ